MIDTACSSLNSGRCSSQHGPISGSCTRSTTLLMAKEYAKDEVLHFEFTPVQRRADSLKEACLLIDVFDSFNI
jgi:hypothetical protein